VSIKDLSVLAYKKRQETKLARFKKLASKHEEQASILQGTDKGIEHGNKAAYFVARVTKMQSNDQIASDDPNAKEKLLEKIADLEKSSKVKKLLNAKLRKASKPAKFHPYEFTNIRNMVRFCKQRLKALSNMDTFHPFSVNGINVVIEAGQIQIDFGFKPNDETRMKLKLVSMKWSSYSKKWVRKYTGQNELFFEALKNIIKTAKADRLP
jgi:hypothetical protein